MNPSASSTLNPQSSHQKVAVVGGNGKIARQLHPLLDASGYESVALVRSEEQAHELESKGISTRMLDIENQEADAFATAFTDCHAVVFAAGGGPDGDVERKRTVDLGGSLKSIEGARRAGVERFVQISAIGVDNPVPAGTDEVWQVYVEAKRDADAALRDSDLRWTILRPGALTDDAATGRVALGEEVERGEVTRADVAAVVAAVIPDGRTVGKQWNLVGGETPLAQAISEASQG